MWTVTNLELLEFWTAEQVAQKLQLHPRTVRRLLTSGELPGKRVGGREWRVSAAALRAYIETPAPAPAKSAAVRSKKAKQKPTPE